MKKLTLDEYLSAKHQFIRSMGVGTRLIEMNTGRIIPTADSVAKVAALTGIHPMELFVEFKRRTSLRLEEEHAKLKARLRN